MLCSTGCDCISTLLLVVCKELGELAFVTGHRVEILRRVNSRDALLKLDCGVFEWELGI
jgi:hypothetical protein